MSPETSPTFSGILGPSMGITPLQDSRGRPILSPRFLSHSVKIHWSYFTIPSLSTSWLLDLRFTTSLVAWEREESLLWRSQFQVGRGLGSWDTSAEGHIVEPSRFRSCSLHWP